MQICEEKGEGVRPAAMQHYEQLPTRAADEEEEKEEKRGKGEKRVVLGAERGEDVERFCVGQGAYLGGVRKAAGQGEGGGDAHLPQERHDLCLKDDELGLRAVEARVLSLAWISPRGGDATNHARALSMNGCSSMFSAVHSWSCSIILTIHGALFANDRIEVSHLDAGPCCSAESCSDGGAVNAKGHCAGARRSRERSKDMSKGSDVRHTTRLNATQ